MMEAPDVSDTPADLPGAQPLGQEAARQESQDSVEVEWGEAKDPNVDAVCKYRNKVHVNSLYFNRDDA
jgi:hypothetical protein